MNVFMLSFPLNIMIGLSLLSASLMLLRERLFDLFNENLTWIVRTIHYLVPPTGGG
jgi:flagellar biosynthesis protein FliR